MNFEIRIYKNWSLELQLINFGTLVHENSSLLGEKIINLHNANISENYEIP